MSLFLTDRDPLMVTSEKKSDAATAAADCEKKNEVVNKSKMQLPSTSSSGPGSGQPPGASNQGNCPLSTDLRVLI